MARKLTKKVNSTRKYKKKSIQKLHIEYISIFNFF